MKVGIVWLPNVGKSTLFNALTKNYSAESGNFPFCTIDSNTGIVNVKDHRVDKLAEISNSEKTRYANMKFVDIAGLVKWASKWEGLGNKFLWNIREVDAIVQVVRYFENEDVTHVHGGVDPMDDIDVINTELIMADLDQLEPHIKTYKKKLKSWEKEAKKKLPVLEKVYDILSEWNIAYDLKESMSQKELDIIKEYNLLTFKPFVYAFNIWEDQLDKAPEIKKQFKEKIDKPIELVCAKLEADMLDFDDEEKQEYLSSIVDADVNVPTLDDLIKLTFDTVGLMYYFTTWEKESRAWTIKKWSTAPEAAGKIHTDFEEGFIRAEVIQYDQLIEDGGWKEAKNNWNMRLEWSDYIVQDGDVIVFRFNN